MQAPDEKDPVFALREVTLGPRAGDYWFITEGLEAGEHVVVHGAFAVDAATQLAGSNSMMTHPSNASLSERVELPEEFRSTFARVVERYTDWKNALVASDTALARRHAGKLRTALEAVDVSDLSPDARKAWNEKAKTLRESAQSAASSDGIAIIRAQFLAASDALILLADNFGSPGKTLRVDWCPMADHDRGAYWVSEASDKEGIRNPYFGDAMLNCGETRKSIPPATAPTAPRAPSEHEGHVH